MDHDCTFSLLALDPTIPAFRLIENPGQGHRQSRTHHNPRQICIVNPSLPFIRTRHHPKRRHHDILESSLSKLEPESESESGSVFGLATDDSSSPPRHAFIPPQSATIYSTAVRVESPSFNMDGTGLPYAPPTSASNASNPASPVDSFPDLQLPATIDTPSTNGMSNNNNNASPQPHSHPAFPGASVYTPTATPSERLNPRSCVTCRRRKVRCDKHMPCSNCRRAQIPCIFPAPGRAPRRPRPKDPNAPPKQPSSEREIELMKRLRKLEGIVEELSGQIEVETARNHSSSGNSPETLANPSEQNTPISGPRGERSDSMAAHSHQGSPSGPDGRPFQYNFNSSSGNLPQRTETVNKKFGRLVINDHGKTRYVSSAFWSKITDEVGTPPKLGVLLDCCETDQINFPAG